MPGLIIGQLAKPDHKLLHHPDRRWRQRADVPSELFRPGHELVVGHDLIDQADAQRLLRIERFIRQQDLHRVHIAQLLHQHAGSGPVADPALGQQAELEFRVLGTGDADVGGGQQHVHPRPGRPAVDRGNHRLPDPRIVIPHPAIDTRLLPVHRSRQGPENPLRAQIFTIIRRQIGPRLQIMAAAEMPVARPRHDRAPDVPVLPQIDPCRGDRIGGMLVQDIGLGRIVQGDVGDPVFLGIVDRHGWGSPWRFSGLAIRMKASATSPGRCCKPGRFALPRIHKMPELKRGFGNTFY